MKKFIVVLAVMFVTTACFADEIYYSIDVSTVMAVMRENGYAVRFDADTDTIVWMHDGVTNLVLFPDTRKKVDNFSYRCVYTIPRDNMTKALELSNTHNREFKFGRSYVTDGTVVYQLDMYLHGGITKERLVYFFYECIVFNDLWKKMVVDNL